MATLGGPEDDRGLGQPTPGPEYSRLEFENDFKRDSQTPITSKSPTTTERQAGPKDYIRVFSYAKRWDIFFMVAAAISSVAAGVTMPLMIAVFGRLVENFSKFDAPDGQSPQSFDDTLNQGSLYIAGLFIARFGLNYINKV